MPRAEWLLSQLQSRAPTDDDRRIARQFYTTAGLPSEKITALTDRIGAYRQEVPAMPGCYQRLYTGQILDIVGDSWRVLTSGGHSPEHACLFNTAKHMLIAGDMVLPRISPNISVWPAEPEADPLSDYFEGLAQLRKLPADTLVLPSHGEPFVGLADRIDELIAHHQERLIQIREYCANSPCTLAEITSLLFNRPLDTHQLSFAVGEALAHINHLIGQGALKRQRQRRGPDLFRC